MMELTSKQCEIVRLLADGKTHKEIALILGIRHTTVRNHVYGSGGKSGIIERLGATTEPQALYLWAMTQPIVTTA